MKIHEYQAKKLFASYNIPISEGVVCKTVEEVAQAYQKFKQTVVLKAQVLTGGRGKAGGVKLAKTQEEAVTLASKILGMSIKGYVVDRLLVAPAVAIVSEYYLGIVVDRNSKSVLLMLSREGGMDIEQVAHETPQLIHRIAVDPSIGMQDFIARRAAFALFDNPDYVKQAVPIIKNLYRLFVETDASLVEVNPMAVLADGTLMAVDAKMTFDDNALYRHPDIQQLFEPDEDERRERDAKSKGISYVKLNGNIGCMVNGAGLAMATMDVVKLYGGQPANFLDIGGSSSPVKVVEAMKLLLSDTNVHAVLINIFGGITRCDDVAKGLILAFEQISSDIPIVVRLSGTNDKEGRLLLERSRFHLADTMSEATRMAVELAGVEHSIK